MVIKLSHTFGSHIMKLKMTLDNQPSSSSNDFSDRFEVIFELLDALQALPSDIREVKEVLSRLEHTNDLCYAILKEQGWLLKDQQLRLNQLETN